MKSNFRKILGVSMTVAMLTSMLVTAAPAMALSSATVVAGNYTIGANTTWDIRFSVANAITGNGTDGGNITITFPSGFSVNQSLAANTTITIAAGPGWLSSTSFGDAILTSTTSNSTAASRKVRMQLATGDVIGADAQVRIIIPVGTITNPSTPGSYNITIATSNETTAVTSANFVLSLPVLGALPGLVTGKNTNGDTIYQDITGNLNTALGTPGVSRVEVGAGTYTTPVVIGTVNQTLIGVGAAGTVIIAPTSGVPLSINAAGVTVDNVVVTEITGASGVYAVVVTDNATIKNSTINGGNYQLSATGAANLVTVDKVIFNVTGNVSRGINSAAANLVVTSGTFSIDASGTGISATGNLTVTGSAFTGSSTSPTGISAAAANTTVSGSVKGSTFTTVRNAVTSSGATGNITVDGNTFTGCGDAAATGVGVFTNTAGIMTLINNTITGAKATYYVLENNSGTLNAHFNTITGNTLNARQDGGTLNASHNWWGAGGPAASSLSAVTAASLITTPYLNGAVSGGTVAFGVNAFTARTTAGVDVATSNGTLVSVIAAKYAANPQTTAPTGTPIAYYDVSFAVASGAEPGAVTIRFYAAVTDNTKVYYGGGLSGAWTLAGTQGVNTANGFAFITITGTSSPSFSDMGGTPFVLTTVVPPPAAPVLSGPAAGAINVPTNTGFSWSAVPGATYELQVSTSPTFATTVASVAGLTSNVYGGVALTANTTYFWRVHAMSGMLMSAWTVSTFTTAAPASATTTAPPVINITAPPPANVTVQAPPPATVTVQAPPPANVTVNPPAVTVQAPPPAQVTVNVPESTPVIPSYILWMIILIGAVLIIALIVLIVRTRRVA